MKINLFKFFLPYFLLLTVASGCVDKKPAPKEAGHEESPQELHLTKTVQKESAFFVDDLDSESMVKAIQSSLRYLNRLPDDEVFLYGKEEYTTVELKESMEIFLSIWNLRDDKEKFEKNLKQFFDFYESPGGEETAKVLFTGYYEPILKATQTRTETNIHPAYALPSDLKVLDLGQFRSELKNKTIVYRTENGEILPYHSREEIMADEALKEKTNPVAWFENPLDLFFLQIQGSGIVEFENGERLRLGYAGANGRDYSSIGRLLIDQEKIPEKEISMQSIRAYLQANPHEIEETLYSNKSYTFFQKQSMKEGPFGNINVPLTPMRSLATDYRIFPKGGLAFIQTEIVDCDAAGNCRDPKPVKRFMLNQDTGGAIRGFGRADIFMGNGDAAAQIAGRQQSLGKLWFLVAKKEYLISGLSDERLSLILDQ